MIGFPWRFCGILVTLPHLVWAEAELKIGDDRLQVALKTEPPAIRNPTGTAVHHEDRIYVIDSRPTLGPSDYDGPEVHFRKFIHRSMETLKDHQISEHDSYDIISRPNNTNTNTCVDEIVVETNLDL